MAQYLPRKRLYSLFFTLARELLFCRFPSWTLLLHAVARPRGPSPSLAVQLPIATRMLPLSGLTLCPYLFLSVISCPDHVIRLAGSEPALHVSTLLFSRSGGRQGSLWERSLHSARRCWFAACSRIQLEQVQLWRGGRLELAVGFPGRMLVGGRLLHGMELLRRGGHRGSIWSPGRRMVRPT